MFGGLDVHIQVSRQIRATLIGTADPCGMLKLLVR